MYQKFVGISAETAALIETHRRNPQETEDDIIRRTLSSPSAPPKKIGIRIGCDLGQGAVLEDDEKIYLFRHKKSRDQGKPDAVAEAKGQALYLYGRRVKKSKGSFVQAALRLYQEKEDDRNPKGEYVSLNAWDYWYVHRNNKFITAGELRDQDTIARRGRSSSSLSADELGL